MKRQLLYIVSAAAILASCKKDSVKVFDESPEDRMSHRMEELNAALLSSAHGWKAALTTSARGGYGFYMDFDKTQSVTMVADLNDKTATEARTSTFRVKWIMNATLIFDTYNHITMLQDPSPAVYGGSSGTGLQSDVEFEFQRSNADTIVLRGFKYKNPLILVKASADEKARYLGAGFKANIDAINDFFATKANNYITLDGIANKVEFLLDKSAKTAKFQHLNNEGAVVQLSGKYNFEDVGINFVNGFVFNGITFVKGKLENGEFVLYDASGKRYVIKQNDTPILPMPLLFAYNGTYRELFVGTSLPAGITSGFNAVWQAAAAKFAAMNPTRTIVDVKFTLTNATTATVAIRNNNGTTTFAASLGTFKYTYENGVITLSNPVYDQNWINRRAQVIDFENFFNSGPFKLDYVTSSDPNVTNIGGLYRVADNTSFFYGRLQK